MNKCAVTETPVVTADENTVVVTHKGEVVGVISVEGTEGVRTLRLTLTRGAPSEPLRVIQGQSLEVF